MKSIEEKCLETTRHISDKIVYLRRANKLTQEAFAEKTGLDIRTIARAECGKHRPSAQTMEIIAQTFQILISYFFDSSSYKTDVAKYSLILDITTHLNIMSGHNLKKIRSFIDLLD